MLSSRPVQKMCLSRHGAHHGRFGNGMRAVGVINGVLDQVKLPLPGVLLKKQFLLAGAIDADRADPDPPKGMAAPEEIFDTGLCSFHAFVVNIPVDIGISVRMKPEPDPPVLAV